MTIDTPVLIVGAGPVGLTMALFLHRHGVPCRIIDKRSEPTTTSNAVGIHARTLELMSTLGITDELMKHGRKVTTVEIGSQMKPLAKWEMKRINSTYNYALCVPQSQTEQILLKHLSNAGIEVERDCELTGLSQDRDSCTAHIKTKQGEIDITSQWLVSCDGYHSAVRDQLRDVSYDGDDMQMRFIMIDAPVEVENEELLDKITVYSNSNVTLMLFPMLETVRFAAEISNCHRYDDIDVADEVIFNEIAKTVLPYSIKIGKPVWSTKFWIHERLASQYRSGRVFLAGDASHAHSPAGGQGMNTGMQDAINLAWKLALVYHSKSNESLLDSYETERRPVAQNVLNKSSKLTHLMVTDNKFVTTVRDTIMPLLSSFGGIQNHMVNELGETSVHYRSSPLNAGENTSHVHPGDLCPLHELRVNDECILLDFNGDLEPNGIKIISGTPEQAETLGLKQGGYCLIRPDGYIAYIGKEKPDVSWLT